LVRLQSGLGGRLVPALAVALSAHIVTAAAKDAPADLLTEAKAAVATAGLTCTVLDARRARLEQGRHGGGRRGGRGGGMGEAEAARPGFIEVACQEGLGYLLPAPASDKAHGHDPAADKPATPSSPATPPQFINCLEAKAANDRGELALQCELKENADQRSGLQALAGHIGLDCTVEAARGLGHTSDYGFFEVACARSPDEIAAHREAVGYVLVADRAFRTDHVATVLSCFEAQSNPRLTCELTHVGSVVDALRRYVAKAQKSCVPTGQRLAGVSPAGDQVFEVGCASKDSYLAVRRQGDAFADLTPCSDPQAAKLCRLGADKGEGAKPPGGI
jgi:hypothetical protein